MKRLFSILLTLCLLVGLVPVGLTDGNVWQSSGGFYMELPEGYSLGQQYGRMVIVKHNGESAAIIWYENVPQEEPDAMELLDAAIRMKSLTTLVSNGIGINATYITTTEQNGIQFEIGSILYDDSTGYCATASVNGEVIYLITEEERDFDLLMSGVHYNGETSQLNSVPGAKKISTAHFSADLPTDEFQVIPMLDMTTDGFADAKPGIMFDMAAIIADESNLLYFMEWRHKGDLADFIIINAWTPDDFTPCTVNGLEGMRYDQTNEDGVIGACFVIPGDDTTLVVFYGSDGKLPAIDEIMSTLVYTPGEAGSEVPAATEPQVEMTQVTTGSFSVLVPADAGWEIDTQTGNMSDALDGKHRFENVMISATTAVREHARGVDAVVLEVIPLRGVCDVADDMDAMDAYVAGHDLLETLASAGMEVYYPERTYRPEPVMYNGFSCVRYDDEATDDQPAQSGIFTYKNGYVVKVIALDMSGALDVERVFGSLTQMEEQTTRLTAGNVTMDVVVPFGWMVTEDAVSAVAIQQMAAEMTGIKLQKADDNSMMHLAMTGGYDANEALQFIMLLSMDMKTLAPGLDWEREMRNNGCAKTAEIMMQGTRNLEIGPEKTLDNGITVCYIKGEMLNPADNVSYIPIEGYAFLKGTVAGVIERSLNADAPELDELLATLAIE